MVTKRNLVKKTKKTKHGGTTIFENEAVSANVARNLNNHFPENMALIAGKHNICIYPYNSTADDLYTIPIGHTYREMVFYPKYLLSFPNVKKFDMLRHVLNGGTIIDDDIIIEVEPNAAAVFNRGIFAGNFWTGYATAVYMSAAEYMSYYRENQHRVREQSIRQYPQSTGAIPWFINNKQQQMMQLYEKYGDLFDNPTMVEIGTITLHSTITGHPPGTVPLMFPQIHRASEYWTTILNNFIRITHQYNEGQRSANQFGNVYIFEIQLDE